MEKKKNWMTLNAHGKKCLKSFLLAISGTDVLTTEMDYLWDRDLVQPTYNCTDKIERHEIAGKCLTDLGISTAHHYFPNYFSRDGGN